VNGRVGPANSWPVNQLARKWLRVAKVPADPEIGYLAHLAWWGLGRGEVIVPPPMSPRHPYQHALELTFRRPAVARPEVGATRWFASNPNLDWEEQPDNLAQVLEEAESPSQAVIQAAYGRMMAASP
jgi:hypothetical protein